MSYTKFPIVIWQDDADLFAATTASGLSASAYGVDAKSCMNQLKKYIQWKSDDCDFEPEFGQPNLMSVDVPVHTQYKIDEAVAFPSETPFRLTVPCVWGMRDDDSVTCYLPTLYTTFRCRHEKLIENLVINQTRNQLRELTPQQLSKFLPPNNISVESMNVRVKTKSGGGLVLKLPLLESVAMQVGSRESRRSFSRAWERDDDISKLAARLTQSRGNVLLLGPTGVGKTTLLAAAVRDLQRQRKIAADNESSEDDGLDEAKIEDRFWMTSADRLISGMQYLGQWEERAEGVIAELSEVRGVLCVTSLEALVRLGGKDPVDSLAAFFAPYLQNNELRMVVEATRAELESCRRLLPGFESLFQIVEVPVLDRQHARSVLTSIGDQSKQNHKIEFDVEAAELCYRLFKRFMPYETFPGKCVGFWSELFELSANGDKHKITCDDVITRFVGRTGLPEVLVRDEYELLPEEVSSWFRDRVIAQHQAAENMTRIITTFKAGLNDPSRPISVQLFCGPTGVGKTEMAKALAEYVFGSGERENRDAKDRLVRLDMSEYSSPGAAERMLMQSDGKPSDFIQRIRKNPFAVVLLDEIEKASHEVFDLLMGVFDEGRLTDRWGRTTDFRSSIIVMTSNLGVRRSQPIGFDEGGASGVYEKEVRNFFRPEFFNRFDAVVPFQPLEVNSIATIAEIELKKIAKREGLTSRSIELVWTDVVPGFLAKKGFDEQLGARPLQRTIEVLVTAPISKLLAESPMTRDELIELDVVDDAVSVKF